ncbi:MAG: PilZ domain-containing protein [Treponema sp.]|nr:PilZ domain-containing protein [Treponema sp.]
MGLDGNGSPLTARQNPFIFTFLLIVAIVILALLIFHLISRHLHKHRTSKKYVDEHKNEITTKKNVQNVARIASLDTEEHNLLQQICTDYKPTNIEYLIKETGPVAELLKSKYLEMIQSNASENEIAVLFSLQYKLEKAHDEALFITTTNSLGTGHEFTYKDIDGRDWVLTLVKNSPQFIELNIPKALAESDRKPEQLSRFILSFTSKGNISYTLQTRAIRYEEAKEGVYSLFISNSNSLKPVQRRKYKRLSFISHCAFSAVKPTAKKADGSTKSYEILENKYDGFLQDISADGARISCSMPIKEEQYIHIKFSINEKEQNAVGLIVSTKKSPDQNQFILHIKFTDISIAAKNQIYAFVYGYTG